MTSRTAKKFDEVTIHFPRPHPKQLAFIQSTAKRKVIRAGRRGGKTVGVAVLAGEAFLAGKRVLYATPTSDQIQRFWAEITRAFHTPIKRGMLKKNETEHTLEVAGRDQRIRAKTAWNADTLRGDYADLLILDEFQLMNEDAWAIVGAPMLLDNNGDAVFVYTPPSLHSRSASKADDPRHAAKMFLKAQSDTKGRWQTFHFTSYDNPHLSREALVEIAHDMSSLALRQEIMAEDIDTAPGALWLRDTLERGRVTSVPEQDLVIVGVDPSATSTGDEAGIIVAGRTGREYYTLADQSLQGSPNEWARAAVAAYHLHDANSIVAEKNNGGEMVEAVIHEVDKNVPVELVHASRGKATRAEPVAAIYEQGRAHHVGAFPALEDEMCLWMPGDASPNRMDALVWAYTKLSENEPLSIEDMRDARFEESEAVTVTAGY